MTAVEFLESEMPKLVYIAKSNKVKFDELINQAKEMEKEQIMNAWDDGQSDGATICTQKADNPSKEYYNKTFRQK